MYGLINVNTNFDVPILCFTITLEYYLKPIDPVHSKQPKIIFNRIYKGSSYKESVCKQNPSQSLLCSDVKYFAGSNVIK